MDRAQYTVLQWVRQMPASEAYNNRLALGIRHGDEILD